MPFAAYSRADFTVPCGLGSKIGPQDQKDRRPNSPKHHGRSGPKWQKNSYTITSRQSNKSALRHSTWDFVFRPTGAKRDQQGPRRPRKSKKDQQGPQTKRQQGSCPDQIMPAKKKALKRSAKHSVFGKICAISKNRFRSNCDIELLNFRQMLPYLVYRAMRIET